LKEDNIKYTICTEGSDSNFHYLRVMLLSLLKHNPWAGNDITIFTCNETPLSRHNRTILESICKNIKFHDIDPNIYASLNIKGGIRKNILPLLYKIEAFNLTENDVVLYVNSSSLCISGLDFVFNGDSEAMAANTGYISRDKRSPDFRKLKVDEFNTSLLLLSKSILSENISSYILDRLSRIKNLTNRIIEKEIKDSLKIRQIEIGYFDLNRVIKKSRYTDSKYNNFLSIKKNVGLIQLDINFSGKNDSSRLMYRKIDSIWQSYNQQGEWNTESKDQRLAKDHVSSYLKKIDLNKQQSSVSINGVSIVIPAHKAELYIEECLDSIKNQNSNVNVEILIGIDNCNSTLDKVSNIKEKYPNLKVVFSNTSVGPYTIRNSLLELAKFDNILFFDADDIMLPNLISEVLKYYHKNRPIRFKYYNFVDGKNYKTHKSAHRDVAHGVFFSPKQVLDKIGGFQPWMCGADTEFMKRCQINRFNDIRLPNFLFYRRIHGNSLTQNSTTNHRSKVRENARRYISTNRDWSIPIGRKIINLIEL
jgi:hypothetical protein